MSCTHILISALLTNKHTHTYKYTYIYIYVYIYRVIHRSLRNFRTRLRNKTDTAERSNACRRNLITGLTSAASPRVHISSTCKVGQKLGKILYLLICSFLPCLSWLLRTRVRKSRRDVWITLYVCVCVYSNGKRQGMLGSRLSWTTSDTHTQDTSSKAGNNCHQQQALWVNIHVPERVMENTAAGRVEKSRLQPWDLLHCLRTCVCVCGSVAQLTDVAKYPLTNILRRYI